MRHKHSAPVTERFDGVRESGGEDQDAADDRLGEHAGAEKPVPDSHLAPSDQWTADGETSAHAVMALTRRRVRRAGWVSWKVEVRTRTGDYALADGTGFPFGTAGSSNGSEPADADGAAAVASRARMTIHAHRTRDDIDQWNASINDGLSATGVRSSVFTLRLFTRSHTTRRRASTSPTPPS